MIFSRKDALSEPERAVPKETRLSDFKELLALINSSNPYVSPPTIEPLEDNMHTTTALDQFRFALSHQPPQRSFSGKCPKIGTQTGLSDAGRTGVVKHFSHRL